MSRPIDEILALRPAGWTDYELIDSGEGMKLERYGRYVIVRPEQQAIWQRSLPPERWAAADARFGRDDRGEVRWLDRMNVPERWPMRYDGMTFHAELTPFRHTGVFPEQAAHWRWMQKLIRENGRQPRVLVLFGYTGLAALAAAQAGASVTYVDASKPSIAWARANQEASGLLDKPIRWLLDDALKFVRRDYRRGLRYEAIVMDPPVFGRGPKGEIWRFFESFPELLWECGRVLADDPLFMLVNAYAVEASSLMLREILRDATSHVGGTVTAGELVLPQKTPAPGGGERVLSTGIFGRWQAEEAR